jgi:hypothetical protein
VWAQFLSEVRYIDVGREEIPIHDRSLRRYARYHLKETLCLMGLKPWKAAQISGECVRLGVDGYLFLASSPSSQLEVES